MSYDDYFGASYWADTYWADSYWAEYGIVTPPPTPSTTAIVRGGFAGRKQVRNLLVTLDGQVLINLQAFLIGLDGQIFFNLNGTYVGLDGGILVNLGKTKPVYMIIN
jgi:hypothetical protein